MQDTADEIKIECELSLNEITDKEIVKEKEKAPETDTFLDKLKIFVEASLDKPVTDLLCDSRAQQFELDNTVCPLLIPEILFKINQPNLSGGTTNKCPLEVIDNIIMKVDKGTNTVTHGR